MLKKDLSRDIGITHLVTHRQKHKHAQISAQSYILLYIASVSLVKSDRMPTFLSQPRPIFLRRPWRARYRIAKALFVLA